MQDAISRKAAALWGGDPSSLKLVSVGNNPVFRMKCDMHTYYMRIIHSLTRSLQEVSAAVHYQQYLVENHVPVCKPLPSLRGELVEKISSQHQQYLVSVNEEVKGDAIHFDHPDKEVYTTWGKSLAHLHRAAKNFPDQKQKFLFWHDLWEETGRFAALENEIIQNEYQAIDQWINNLNINQHDFGLIHGDHQTGKVFYDGEKIYLLNSDKPVYHWFFADLAMPFFDMTPDQFDKAVWFLEGYQVILDFNDEKVQDLPWFVRMKIMDEYIRMKHGILNGVENAKLMELFERIKHPVRSWDL